MRRSAIGVFAIVSAIAGLLPGAAGARHAAARHAPGFDYYVMALSWSPSWCLAHPDDPDQCGSRGFGFILHGLWPQYRDGSWPQHCASSERPDAATVARTLAFMPSRRLVEHEWSTHGACSGASPSEYFATADRAFATVRIPQAMRAPRSAPALSARDVVRAFEQANPGLGDAMLTVECHNGYELTEVRVCLNRDTLEPQACGGRVRNSCRSGTLRIPAVR